MPGTSARGTMRVGPCKLDRNVNADMLFKSFSTCPERTLLLTTMCSPAPIMSPCFPVTNSISVELTVPSTIVVRLAMSLSTSFSYQRFSERRSTPLCPYMVFSLGFDDLDPISGGSFLSAVLAQAGPSLVKYNRKPQRLGPMNNWTEQLSSAKVSTEVG